MNDTHTTNTETPWSPITELHVKTTPGSQSVQAEAGTPKKIRRATYKEAKLAELVSTTPMTNRDAYREAYDAERMSDDSVDTEVSRTLNKPQVKIELAKYNDTARSALLEVVEQSRERMKSSGDRDFAPIAKVLQTTADSVLDRTEGKSVQRIQSTSTAVTLNLSLSDLVNSGEDDTAS